MGPVDFNRIDPPFFSPPGRIGMPAHDFFDFIDGKFMRKTTHNPDHPAGDPDGRGGHLHKSAVSVLITGMMQLYGYLGPMPVNGFYQFPPAHTVRVYLQGQLA